MVFSSFAINKSPPGKILFGFLFKIFHPLVNQNINPGPFGKAFSKIHPLQNQHQRFSFPFMGVFFLKNCFPQKRWEMPPFPKFKIAGEFPKLKKKNNRKKIFFPQKKKRQIPKRKFPDQNVFGDFKKKFWP